MNEMDYSTEEENEASTLTTWLVVAGFLLVAFVVGSTIVNAARLMTGL